MPKRPAQLRATADEIAAVKRVVAEAEAEGDIVPVWGWERYQDLNKKVARIFEDGVATGADFVAKVDDDTCLRPRRLLRTLRDWRRTRKPGAELYLGRYLFKGTEYEAMRGADGTIAPFQSGTAVVLSANLARTIFDVDRLYTTFFQPYGTSFDDANLGKWVQRAERVHGLAVDKVAQHGIGVDLAKTEGPLPLGDEVVRRKATG